RHVRTMLGTLAQGQAICHRQTDVRDVRVVLKPSIAALRAPAEMPTALSSVPRYADIACRLVLASRLPSRAAPALNPHSARCLAGAQLPATSCLGAFWTPVSSASGGAVIAGVQKPAQQRN